MMEVRKSGILRAIPLLITICLFSLCATRLPETVRHQKKFVNASAIWLSVRDKNLRHPGKVLLQLPLRFVFKSSIHIFNLVVDHFFDVRWELFQLFFPYAVIIPLWISVISWCRDWAQVWLLSTCFWASCFSLDLSTSNASLITLQILSLGSGSIVYASLRNSLYMCFSTILRNTNSWLSLLFPLFRFIVWLGRAISLRGLSQNFDDLKNKLQK